MEPDAHVTVQPPQSLYPQKVLSISSHILPLIPGAHQRPGAPEALSPAADDRERSEGAAQQDPVQEQRQPGPG